MQESNHEVFPGSVPEQTLAEQSGSLEVVGGATQHIGTENELFTTSNGHEIEHPREKLDVEELKSMLEEYGLSGDTPHDRVVALRHLPKESFALFLTDLNRRLQGSDNTLVHDKTMKIGDKQTIAPEDRYDLFTDIYEKIQKSNTDINPERLGDALALATVLLHPFKDGNGRTARALGYMYRADFNDPEAATDFSTLIEPRDQARERGGFIINGYVPYLGEGADQSDPTQIDKFIVRVLHDESDRIYTGPYGQAELKEVV